MTAPQSELVRRRPPAHLSRTRHPAPWARRATPQLVPPAAARRPQPATIPVFVDDSGRRRRAGRMFGICLGALALGYVAVVAMTFAGVPVVGSLAPPGVEQLARPAGDEGADVGPGAQETPLPAAAVADPATSTPSPGAQASTSANDAEGTTGETPAPSATTAPTSDPAATTTTTVTAPGEGATTSVPAPASTVPTSPTHPITAGPPTEPPGKP